MIWSVRDVEEGVAYGLSLCQATDGRRYAELAPKKGYVKHDLVVLTTQEVPRDLLLKRNLDAISRVVRLEGGARFCVEAHGVWLTESEVEQLMSDVEEIKWATDAPPSCQIDS